MEFLKKYSGVIATIAIIVAVVAIFKGGSQTSFDSQGLLNEVRQIVSQGSLGGAEGVFTNYTDLQLGSCNKATSTTQGSFTQNDLTRLPISGACTASTTAFNFQNPFRATSTIDICGGSIVEITNGGGGNPSFIIGTTSATSPTATGTTAFLNGQPIGRNSLLIALGTTSMQATKPNLTVGPTDYIVGQFVRNGDDDSASIQSFITNGSCDYSITVIRDN